MNLNEADKAIIKTLAFYVLLGELEQNKKISSEMWKEQFEGLTEIQKQVASYFETEKGIIIKKIMKNLES